MAIQLWNNFLKLNPAEKMFLITVTIISAESIYFICNLVPITILSFAISAVAMTLIIINLEKYSGNELFWFKSEMLLYGVFGCLIFYLPTHFLASSRIAFRKKRLDDAIIEIDDFLIGWIFEKGQASLYLDTNNALGPHTPFGQMFNNLLQIFYMLYYVVPYASIYLYLLPLCIKETLYRKKNNGGKSPKFRQRWNKVFYLSSSYNLTMTLVFFINTLVPASSPRLYFKDEYVNPLKLSGIAGFINKICKDDKSANSFPSGHVAETIVFAFGFFATKNKKAAVLILVTSILIAFATIFLRYHYFADVLLALIIAIFNSVICYKLGYKKALKEEIMEIPEEKFDSVDLTPPKEVAQIEIPKEI